MAKKKETFSFDAAYEEVQQIVKSIQESESIDGIEQKITRANELIATCKEKLRSLEQLTQQTSEE